jgi:hypothetical protein
MNEIPNLSLEPIIGVRRELNRGFHGFHGWEMAMKPEMDGAAGECGRLAPRPQPVA